MLLAAQSPTHQAASARQAIIAPLDQQEQQSAQTAHSKTRQDRAAALFAQPVPSVTATNQLVNCASLEVLHVEGEIRLQRSVRAVITTILEHARPVQQASTVAVPWKLEIALLGISVRERRVHQVLLAVSVLCRITVLKE